jgi:hypothetical protein
MTDLPLPLPYGDRVFWLLSLSIVIVALCAVGMITTALMLRRRNNRTARQWAAREAVWDPVILDVLEGARPLEDLSRLVRQHDRRYFVTYLLRYVRMVRGGGHDIVQQLARPHLTLVAAELRHRQPERRALAVQILGELGPHEYRDRIAGALDDSAPLVTVIAAGAIARDYSPRDVRHLLERVGQLELWTVRFLVSMMQRMGPESAWAFREVLADPTRSNRVRTIAGHVLALFNDLPSGDLAAEVLETSHDADLQVAALRVLEHVGAAEHLPVVRRLARDPEPAVRGHAVRVLAEVGGEAELVTIRAALEDESHWVAIHAVAALKRLGHADLLRSLVEKGHRWSTAVHEVFLPGTA